MKETYSCNWGITLYYNITVFWYCTEDVVKNLLEHNTFYLSVVNKWNVNIAVCLLWTVLKSLQFTVERVSRTQNCKPGFYLWFGDLITWSLADLMTWWLRSLADSSLELVQKNLDDGEIRLEVLVPCNWLDVQIQQLTLTLTKPYLQYLICCR